MGRKIICKKIGFNKNAIEETLKIFGKYGAIDVLIGRCDPIIKSLIFIPTGMMKMNFGKSILYME